ncbi:unnamed protein product [Dicrocoelium dendriticum]|nr:unnamed protein product [Dicrocoelium dendriticum]
MHLKKNRSGTSVESEQPRQASAREFTKPLLSVRTSAASTFEIIAECSTSRARRCEIWLPHCPAGSVETPVFMPVGTQGSVKGITVEQLEALDCRILLGNTYHLGHRPGPDLLTKLNLRQARYESDFRPIDEDCSCPYCTRRISRAFIHASLSGRQTNASSIVSLHNLTYMLTLMKGIREAISSDSFPRFVRHFFERRCYLKNADQTRSEYDGFRPPSWAVDALAQVGIDISDIGLETDESFCQEEVQPKKAK